MIAILFPNINPVAFRIFNFDIYWYSFAYIFGVAIGYVLLKYLNKKEKSIFSEKALDDLIFFIVIGVIVGARLGSVLFFDYEILMERPLMIFEIRKGGLSFHGGAIGVMIAIYLLCRKHKMNYFAALDLVACVAPIGLFFGRIANFINGEVYGRVTDVSWGMVFPRGGLLPRHPSQLYEAALEGILLFAILLYLNSKPSWRQNPGRLSGAFMFFYGCFRFAVEYIREPDYPGYVLNIVTVAQLLCMPMIVCGIYLMCRHPAKLATVQSSTLTPGSKATKI